MTLFKEETMLVHPVAVPGSGTRSWTVLGDDDVPVVPVDRFLAYLTSVGRSPNTVRAPGPPPPPRSILQAARTAARSRRGLVATALMTV
jgi:hypothetical protein